MPEGDPKDDDSRASGGSIVKYRLRSLGLGGCGILIGAYFAVYWVPFAAMPTHVILSMVGETPDAARVWARAFHGGRFALVALGGACFARSQIKDSAMRPLAVGWLAGVGAMSVGESVASMFGLSL